MKIFRHRSEPSRALRAAERLCPSDPARSGRAVPLLILSLLLAVLFLAGTVRAEVVDSGDCGEKLTWTLDDAGKLTISGSGKMADYSIDNLPPWHGKVDSILNLEIKSGVTSIGNYAFTNCYSLSSVAIPDSVESIGFSAFNGSDLRYVTFGDKSKLTSIGDNAFALAGFTSINIPDSVTSIGAGAFRLCIHLESVTIPDSVTSIGYAAFADCTWLTSVTIQRGTEALSLGKDVFKGSAADTVRIQFPEGSTLDFDITENAGYKKSGSSLLLTDSYQSTAAADLTLYCDISVEVKPEDSGSVTGAGHKAPGETVTLSPSPAEYYVFDKWTEGESVFTANPYTFTAEKNRSLTANFRLKTYTVSTGVAPQNSGTVTGAGTYDAGKSATVTATPATGYHFVNWTEGDTVITENPYTFPVNGARTLTAHFALNQYTITFVDEDGTELQSGKVPYGEKPVYGGKEPTKESTDEKVYAFAGWYPEIEAVTGEATYKAVFSDTSQEYAVTFVDEDGTVLKAAVDYPYGTPAADIARPDDPVKAATDQYTFTFAGWTPEISDVKKAQTYTASYESTVNQYTITFTDEDGTELQSGKVPYGETPAYTGETPSKPADTQNTYTFAGWDPKITVVSGDAVYKATYSTDKIAKLTVQPEAAADLKANDDPQDLLSEPGKAEGGTVMYSVNGGDWSDAVPQAKDADSYEIRYYIKGTGTCKDNGSPDDPLGTLTVTIAAPEPFEVKVNFVFIKKDSSRGLPFDIKLETLKPVLTIKDGDEVISKAKPLELTLTLEKNEIPGNASFSKEVELAPGKYTVSVSGLPKEIEKEIPDGNAKDAPKYSLSAKAEINMKEGEPVITVYLIFTPPAPKIEEPVVYPLPEDEIGAYALRRDGTKEYLLFHTYDICMEWLGRDDLCRGYERCFHKDGK